MGKSKYDKCSTFKTRYLKGVPLVGKLNVPQLQSVHDIEPRNLTPFNAVLTTKRPCDRWFHHYVDDEQFERLWNDPSKYLPRLIKFEGGISPDYSMYYGDPYPVQVWNCWRNRVLAYIMQTSGITIIPNACWSDEASLDWAFDGLPENSVLAITTQGCMGGGYSMQTLINGLHELVRQKRPEKLIVYGRFRDEWRDRFPMPITVMPSFAQERWAA